MQFAETPLHESAGTGNKTITNLLLSAKALVDAEKSTRRTPLSYSATQKHFGVYNILLAAKANMETSHSVLPQSQPFKFSFGNVTSQSLKF